MVYFTLSLHQALMSSKPLVAAAPASQCCSQQGYNAKSFRDGHLGCVAPIPCSQDCLFVTTKCAICRPNVEAILKQQLVDKSSVPFVRHKQCWTVAQKWASFKGLCLTWLCLSILHSSSANSSHFKYVQHPCQDDVYVVPPHSPVQVLFSGSSHTQVAEETPVDATFHWNPPFPPSRSFPVVAMAKGLIRRPPTMADLMTNATQIWMQELVSSLAIIMRQGKILTT